MLDCNAIENGEQLLKQADSRATQRPTMENRVHVRNVGVITATRGIVDSSQYPKRWCAFFAIMFTLAVVGLLSILSAIVHKLCMPNGTSNHAGMDMPSAAVS